MFDRVLNMPLDYLSYFAMVLKRIHGKVDISQTDYSIHSKLIFPYSEIIHGSTTLKLMKGQQQRLKNNHQPLNLMFLFFLSFSSFQSNVPENKCHKQKWHMLFFTRIKLVAHVLACVCTCNCTHQMEKTDPSSPLLDFFLEQPHGVPSETQKLLVPCLKLVGL